MAVPLQKIIFLPWFNVSKWWYCDQWGSAVDIKSGGPNMLLNNNIQDIFKKSS